MARRRRAAKRGGGRSRYQFGALQLCPCGSGVSGLGGLGIDVPSFGPRPSLYTSQIDTPYTPRALSPELPPLPSEHDEPHRGGGFVNLKTLLVIGAAGVGGYFLYTRVIAPKKSKSVPAAANWSPGGITTPTDFVTAAPSDFVSAPVSAPPPGGFWSH